MAYLSYQTFLGTFAFLQDHFGHFLSSVKFGTNQGVQVPSGKILRAKQLTLTFGPYTVYSGRINAEYFNCQQNKSNL